MSDNPEVHLIAYADGSSISNPGYAGYGVTAYTYKKSVRPKNTKHPGHPTVNLTSDGYAKEKNEVPIEVLSYYEGIFAIPGDSVSNNTAELAAVIRTLSIASKVEFIKSVTIYTDSNYIVTAFTESLDTWSTNGWCKTNGKPIVHTDDWQKILMYREHFKLANVTLDIIWVKGHADNFGNTIADLFSNIGSNSAKYYITQNLPFNEVILERWLPHKEFKLTYEERDILLYFRDLYFTSNAVDDTNYCFISTSEDIEVIGKRNNTSLFATTIGYVPPFVNTLKTIYREIPRNVVSTCSVRLSRLSDKELYRLFTTIDARLLIKKLYTSYGVPYYALATDNSPFMFEVNHSYPFFINASKLFSKTYDIATTELPSNINVKTYDLTNKFISEGKLVITAKTKYIDLTETIGNDIRFTQIPILSFGLDVLPYLALKRIESVISKVTLLVVQNEDSNFATFYVKLETNDRTLYTINIENKYLTVKF